MASDKITTPQILIPLSLLSFVVMLFLGFQTSLLVGDHQELVKAKAAQDKALEQIDKVKAQATALALGALKLAKEGDKNAQEIIDLMKKSGIQVSDQGQPSSGATPAQTPPPEAPPASN